MGVGYRDEFFTINDKKMFLFCGEMHYFRIPKSMWFDRILKAKRAGLNCVASYIAWNWHEPVENLAIFGDSIPPSPYESKAFSRDLESYMKIVKDLGLYFIARPGPYICSEWDSGGHPNWLYNKVAVLRSLDENYIKYSEKWYSTILPIIAKYTVSNNGPVAVLQIENEYFWGDVKYLMKLYEIARKYVNDIPIITNEDWHVEGTPIINTIDSYPSPWDVKGFDDKVRGYVKTQLGMPKMFMELEGGWFSTFGASLPTNRGSFPAEWTEVLMKTAIGMGINGISIYMFHGGTNPGYYAGKYITTTYDYEAAIREWGELSKRYYTIKRVALFTKTFNDFIAETKPVEDGVKTTVTGLDVFTRIGGDNSALIVLRNLGSSPQQTKIVFRDSTYPLQGLVRVPERNAKIVLANYRIPGTPFKLLFTSSEPLLIDAFDKKTVLIVYGDPLERGEIDIESNQQMDIVFTRDVYVSQQGSRTIISYVHGESDKIAVLRSGEYELYILAVSRSRADRTWYIDDFKPPITIVSNIYFVGIAKRDGDRVSIELELDDYSCGPITILSPKPITKILLGGREVGVENLYGILYISKIDLCKEQEKIVLNIGEELRIAEEGEQKGFMTIEPRKPLESLGMLFNGYVTYSIEFNLSKEDMDNLRNKMIYMSYFNDYATAILNGVPLSSGYHSIEADASKALREGLNRLHIVLESTGHTNDGLIYIPNGVVGGIYLGKVDEISLDKWLYIEYRFPYGKDFSKPMFLHNPIDIEKILHDYSKGAVKTIEVENISSGRGLYVKKIVINKKIGRYILDLGRATDNYYPRTLLFINKKFITIYTGPTDITDHLIDGENEIAIAVEGISTTLYPVIKVYQKLVEGVWKVKYGTKGLDEKWFTENYNDSSWEKTKLPIIIRNREGNIVWIRGKLFIEYKDNIPPLKLVLKGSGIRALIYFNDQFLGRYVDEGPQTEFYIPETIVRKGKNMIAIMLHIISNEASINIIDLKPYYMHLKAELTLM
ncbi:MAG: beta-galactosidase [Ignisphaera sp.]